MPHYPKPFFRALRGLWYVQIDGRQVNLGPDRDEAFRRYHELMARRSQTSRNRRPATPWSRVLDAFLDWCQKHRAPRTYDWYRDYLQSFARSIPRDLAVDRLKPIHVQQWVDAQPGWGTRQAGGDHGRPAGVQLGGEDGADRGQSRPPRREAPGRPAGRGHHARGVRLDPRPGQGRASSATC